MLLPNISTLAVMVAVTVAGAAASGIGKSVMLSLERRNDEGMEVSQLRWRDQLRHGRLLKEQINSSGIVDFPVQGTYNPFLVGLYYTRIQLGSPPREFYVQIDTGSDVLWVGCDPCIGCPLKTDLNIKLELYNPSESTTSSSISCSDSRCALGYASSDSSCSISNDCVYNFKYGDGSGTSGYFVSDLLNLDFIMVNSKSRNSLADVVFGCSTLDTGDLASTDRAVDGIFGFGQASLSVISQLSSQRITPHAFSHCLDGRNSGGGILVLGQVVHPNMVYTSIVPSQPHYNVNLQSISVDGNILSIDPSLFGTSDNGGTIVDSGTTLAYFPDEAYDTFVQVITQSVSQSVQPFIHEETQCYITNSSVLEIFPPVALNFDGGVSMELTPINYLLQFKSTDTAGEIWCIGIQPSSGQGYTILGDIILQNKVVVYDLAGQKIGWMDYDCSSSVNVSTINGTYELINAGQSGNNNGCARHPGGSAAPGEAPASGVPYGADRIS
ncbi:aspartic protein-like protein 2 [Dorcoceras hygrometricum]|uniref:Aspartic protein-like protein 2 n=1 Tax=Dorcoceras hygrometricum TaxID=472368 RepID=A0A2Z7CYB0_9LAMI|nr:aspartic protein-like protein 2 [Dorcoceras hygrometricum]